MRLHVILWERPSREDRMCKLDEIMAKRDEIRALAQKYKVLRIFVFGSCARKEETPDSDIDLIAEFGDKATLFDQTGLEFALSDFFHCPVDVVSYKRLRKKDRFSLNVRREMQELC